MELMKRISLKERLQVGATASSIFFNVFECYLEDYFNGLSVMNENLYFANIYQNEVRGIVENDNVDILIASVPQVISDLPQNEQTKALFKILVEPFAYMKKMEDKSNEPINKET